MAYYDIKQPEEISLKEREDAMGGYLMMFASMAIGLPLPILNLIAAIIYYYINRSKSRFIHFHALQSLLSQIPTTALNVGAVYWSLHIFISSELEISNPYLAYLGMTLVADLAYFIFSIIAAVQARKGKMYYFLFFGPLAYKRVYAIHPKKEEKTSINNPPRL